MLDYNVPGGKLNRGMAVLDVLRALKDPAVRHIWPQLTRGYTWLCPPRGSSITPCSLSALQVPSSEEAFKANALGWCIEWVRPSHTPRQTGMKLPWHPCRALYCSSPLFNTLMLYTSQRAHPAKTHAGRVSSVWFMRAHTFQSLLYCMQTSSLTVPAAASLLPGGRRHHGQLHHEEGAAVLVQATQGASRCTLLCTPVRARCVNPLTED